MTPEVHICHCPSVTDLGWADLAVTGCLILPVLFLKIKLLNYGRSPNETRGQRATT